jgi:probable HAF family extracellular repeat protein
MGNRIRTGALILLGFTAACPALGANYSIQDLGTLGGPQSEAAAINNKGQVVGRADTAIKDASGFAISHAFLYDGTMHDLGTLAGGNSESLGINSSGGVTGDSQTSSGNHPFYYDGTMHDLGANGVGTGVNSAGHIVGYLNISGSITHAFYYDGVIHDIGVPNFDPTLAFSHAWGINDANTVIGSTYNGPPGVRVTTWKSTTQTSSLFLGDGTAVNAVGNFTGTDAASTSQPQAFLYDGIIHDLGTLGGTRSEGFAINSTNWIVGQSATVGNAALHAFVYNGSGMFDLNSLIAPNSGWELTIANGINDSGQIVGNGIIGGVESAFLLTPVSEPSSPALAASVVLVFAALHFRKIAGAIAVILSA